jgi:hypothetical protein
MPSFSQHTHQAQHNADLLNILVDQDLCKRFSDWYVTISFYCSVHLIEGIINKSGKFHVNNIQINAKNSEDIKRFFDVKSEHEARRMLMKDNIEIFGKVFNAHQNLYEMSRTARYKCYHPEAHDYIDSEKCLDDVKNEFKKITKQ